MLWGARIMGRTSFVKKANLTRLAEAKTGTNQSLWRSRRKAHSLLISLILTVASGILVLAPTVAQATTPPGFAESTVFSGLTNPTVVRFSSDGRVFVAEKRGIIKVFDSLTDTSPTVFADLNVNVHNFWDRGLLGMALDPGFPTQPYIYVMYTYDHQLGSASPAPRWGTPGVYSDPCPTPPGATDDGCVVSGRISRLRADGNTMTGAEQVLVEDWCQQYPSHSVGTVEFGRDGALYASGGDGASFNWADFGQDGSPLNPCGDPPGGVGATLTAPTAEGGALRSQDLRTSGDPVSLDGSLIRVDPATGAGLPGNPLASSTDPNARRIISHGFRNPFRFTARPGTDQLWVGDVGWNDWEEINVVNVGGAMQNFGWPCFEGVGRQSGYDGYNLNICENLYANQAAVTAPFHAYHHSARVVPNETCPTGSSAIAGLQFEFAAAQNSYPSEYDGALFFADYTRDCIWAMPRGTDGQPAPGLVRGFVSGAANPVNLENGPGGDLFYVDFDGGTIRRITYTSANQTPVAVAKATPTTGSPPLTVNFDGTGSSDPDAGDVLSYAWDLDADGAYDDSTLAQPSYTYTAQGSFAATLKVTDRQGATDTDSVTIAVGNTAPTAVINAPAAGTTWKVGDVINFSGSATDAQDGTLPASALSWELILQHCPSNCHAHALQQFVGVSSGSFTAPDHEYPSYLELKLTATDSGGLTNTKTLRLDPRTVTLTFQTTPGGLLLAVDGSTTKSAFNRVAIIGSTHTVSAPAQTKGGRRYEFSTWSDGGTQTHTITAPATATTYTARFK
jgi:glucose/arabinose dehydrogenase